VSRRFVIALFAGTAVLALAQDLVRRRIVEPFPALLMPSFAAARGMGETTTVVLSVLEAESASGERFTAPARMLTRDASVLPDAVLRVIAFRELSSDGLAGGDAPRPAWVQRLAGQRAGRTRGDVHSVIDAPETALWLRARTAEIFPGHEIVRARVIWREVEIDRDTEAVRTERVVKRVELFPR
jgi:hypothetical protein